MKISFDNTYVRLPERFYANQAPASVPEPKLFLANRQLAERLRIDPDWLGTAEAASVFSGNTVPEGAQPISQVYAGHQFGGFVPQLGDGRAILLGEIVGEDNRRYDIQLKGSGRTPFSRNGDGKSALGPVVREFIVSEAMAALGVPTTRALAAVTTGETIWRQEGQVAGGVFTRVASSHIRVGTFQYFNARQDTEALRQLADYVIARHYPEAYEMENPYIGLLESVLRAQAELIAHWMSIGFIHGVMNTDNCAVSGETIDYGPCAFMDTFHPQCVFSSIDRGARYAWGNQAEIGLWNLTRFAETLLSLISKDQNTAMALAEASLSGFAELFGDTYARRFRNKFGLSSDAPFDIVVEGLNIMAVNKVDFTIFFRQLTKTAVDGNAEPLSQLFAQRKSFDSWFRKWRMAVGSAVGLKEMQRVNPVRIPRNHRVEEAIQAAYREDFSAAERLIAALSEPYKDIIEFSEFELPPSPDEVVHETFCGT